MTGRVSIAAAALALMTTTAPGLAARQAPAGRTWDVTVPPGPNYDNADFRLWLPAGVDRVTAVVVLVPGSNGDGRAMAEDPFWQAFAARQTLGLLACRLTDKPHDQGFIEAYADVSKGSGDALLHALSDLAGSSGHAELSSAPLFLWGMSAGGEVNYEFVNWKPERVAAFIVNKGGIYYTALASRAAREVPGLLFTGGKDLASRIETITGLFALNRRGGALWALVEEPGAAHVVGQSRDFGALFFEDLLPLRVGAPGEPLRSMAGRPGFVGDLKTHTYAPAVSSGTPGDPNVWLPTERIARAWQAVVTGQPVTGR
jgi:poly(3-hydroxybutyrate) depolymerase